MKRKLLEETHYYPHGLPMGMMGTSSVTTVENRHKHQGNEYKKELGLNWMDFGFRQYDPQIGRFMGVDPLADYYGQDRYSPYAAMGNQPESMIDPNGLKYEVFMDAVLTAPDLPIESTDALDRAGHMSRMKIEDIDEINHFFNTSLLLVSNGDTENLISSYYSEQQQAAITSSIVESVIESFAPTGTGAFMRSDAGVEGDGLINQINEGGQNGSTSTATGQATVYIETDGVGHVYVDVDGTVFSYGRYNGSYSPSSGQFGPYGDGVLLKMEGTEASDFIKERTEKYPTNSYKIDINLSDAYSYFNNLYEGGKPVVNKKTGQVGPGRVIDTYTLVGPGGNNCATLVCRGLNAGGANIGIFQSPSSLNLFFFNSNTIKNGYNPGLWGPKR